MANVSSRWAHIGLLCRNGQALTLFYPSDWTALQFFTRRLASHGYGPWIDRPYRTLTRMPKCGLRQHKQPYIRGEMHCDRA
jgi:hypothetical protein